MYRSSHYSQGICIYLVSSLVIGMWLISVIIYFRMSWTITSTPIAVVYTGSWGDGKDLAMFRHLQGRYLHLVLRIPAQLLLLLLLMLYYIMMLTIQLRNKWISFSWVTSSLICLSVAKFKKKPNPKSNIFMVITQSPLNQQQGTCRIIDLSPCFAAKLQSTAVFWKILPIWLKNDKWKIDNFLCKFFQQISAPLLDLIYSLNLSCAIFQPLLYHHLCN